MDESHEYRGSLSDTPLPEMLAIIDRLRVAGRIDVRQGETEKCVHLSNGYVVHASSSDRSDSLGEYLKRKEKLSPESVRDVAKQRRVSNRRYGVLLIERELLTPIEVYQAIREHIEEIVWSLFFWDEGDVVFAAGDSQEEDRVEIQIPLRRVILQGIKRAPDARPLVSRLGRRSTVLEPRFRWEDLIEIGLAGEEYRLLMLVDAKKTLYELCAEGPLTPAENAKLLYAFQVLDLVQRRPADSEPTGPVKIKLDTAGDNYGL